ncbi:MAG: hypothetical protein RH859_07220 [Longimicrobiales bacterium]
MIPVATIRRGLVLLGAGLLVPALATAQDPPPDPPPVTELVFEREVFDYPTFQRRNPFRPLDAGDQGGPRFEQLRLMGIIYSDDPSSSVAILGTSTVDVAEDGATVTVSPDGEAWYLKIGQSIGNVRIVEIRREQVVVEIEEFGLTEQRIMQLETRRLGGTP